MDLEINSEIKENLILVSDEKISELKKLLNELENKNHIHFRDLNNQNIVIKKIK